MLKPIYHVGCSPALAACQRLMQRFVLWLCDANVNSAGVTQAQLHAHLPSVIEADWVWTLLTRSTGGQTFLERARAMADLPGTEKLGLTKWIHAVAKIAQHFSQLPPAPLPCKPPNGWIVRDLQWKSFKVLMEMFYDPGLREGLPYQINGNPTNDPKLQVTYTRFLTEFRQLHRLDPHPDAREVCVLRGGELRVQEIDHWVRKGAFPLLTVCADNLLPVCGECNDPSNKGQKDVHTGGVFADWFHPYLCHANGTICLQYDPATFRIRVTSCTPMERKRVDNIDQLLNLGERWTREFKAEYLKKRREVERQKSERLKNGEPPLDEPCLVASLTSYRDRLSNRDPNYEVHRVVADALLDPVRLQALLA